MVTVLLTPADQRRGREAVRAPAFLPGQQKDRRGSDALDTEAIEDGVLGDLRR